MARLRCGEPRHPALLAGLGSGSPTDRIAFRPGLQPLEAGDCKKVIGVGGGAMLGGFTRGEAWRLGICMISRGEVGLIMASIGLTRGIFDDDVFPSLLLAILVSTLVTPPLVRLAFRGVTLEAGEPTPPASFAATPTGSHP